MVDIRIIQWEFLDYLDSWYHSENFQPKDEKRLQFLDETDNFIYYLEIGDRNTIWRKPKQDAKGRKTE